MLLSGTGIRLRIYLRTHDGDDILVELESDDIEKAAMAKAQVTEEEVHPVKLVRFELTQPLVNRRGTPQHPSGI